MSAKRLWIHSLAAVLVLAACGDDDDGGGENPEPMIDASARPDAPDDDQAPDGGDVDAAIDAAPTENDIDGGPIDAAPVDASIDATPIVPDGELCDNGIDDDGDSKIDCQDIEDCADVFVCQAPTCALGTRVFLSGAELPAFIKGGQTTTSKMNFAQDGAVLDAAAKINLMHGFVGDLSIRLTTPSGFVLDVSSKNGGSGDNYQETLFIDGATTSVVMGAAPFHGSFRPEQPFTGLKELAAKGDWTMSVVEHILDNNPTTDDGVLYSAELMLCVCINCERGATCVDGVDNDTDGNADCADSDCATDPHCIPETNCGDNVDNDLDGKTDCLDETCNNVGQCQFGNESNCTDGFDNDADGLKDCADPTCATTFDCTNEVNCTDGLDNDNDMKIDCLDQDCNGKAQCQFGTETNCSDNFDNDADGAKDCADPNCSTAAFCIPESDCDDLLDNDMDGQRDCQEPGCQVAGGKCELKEQSCNDGFDNDGDLHLDCGDTDCFVTCAVPSCPPGQVEVKAFSTDVPKEIPDVSFGESKIVMTGSGIVTRVIVTTSIVHAWIDDVDLTLIAPGETAPGLDLCSDNGSSNDDLKDIIFSDTATSSITSITNAAWPPAGAFKPETPLSTLNGRPLAGTWTLRGTDDAGGIAGSIERFDLTFCVTP